MKPSSLVRGHPQKKGAWQKPGPQRKVKNLLQNTTNSGGRETRAASTGKYCADIRCRERSTARDLDNTRDRSGGKESCGSNTLKERGGDADRGKGVAGSADKTKGTDRP